MTRNVTQRIVESARENGLLILGGVAGLIDGSGGDHFELLPPYTIEESDLDFLVDTLRASLVTVLALEASETTDLR
jgi:adenosylmethionine-8-amino-7-oxononanoate aminotransferase